MDMSSVSIWQLVERQFSLATKAVENLQQIEGNLAFAQATAIRVQALYEAYPTAENLALLKKAMTLFEETLAIANQQKAFADSATAKAAELLALASRAEGLSDAGDNPAGS